MPVGNVGVSGYTRKSSTGKLVHVKKYTQKRDLVAEMQALGRSQVAAPAGQMPGGRTIPLSPGVSREQLKLQKAQLAALRKQVKAMRAANPELAAQVQSTSKQMGKTVSAQLDREKKKVAKEKSLEAAKKLQQTRGADPEKLKKATEQLDKAVQSEKNRKAAAEAAAKTRADNKAAEEKAAAAEKEKNTPKELTPEERAALESYGYNGYKIINSQLRFRNGLDGLDDKYAEDRQVRDEILAMDSAIEKSPLQEPKTLWRGVHRAVVSKLGVQDPMEPGTILEDKAFLSFSEDKDFASGDFGSGFTIQVDLPAGYKALDMVGRGTQDAGYAHEKEFILGRDTKLEVISDETQKVQFGPGEKDFYKQRLVTVRAVPSEGEQNGTGQQGQGSQEASPGTQESSPATGQEGGSVQDSGAPSAQPTGVQGQNDVGAGGLDSNPPTPEVTPEDLAFLGTSPDLTQMQVSDWQAAMAPLVERAQKVWGGQIGDYEFRVNRALQSTDHQGVNYMGSIHDSTGKQVGEFGRGITGDTALHKMLFLKPDVQGQKISHNFNRQAEEAYKAMGVKKITLNAQDTGSYAWARAGYDWDTGHPDYRNNPENLAAEVRGILDRIESESDSLLDSGDLSFYDLVQEQIAELRQRIDDYKYGVDTNIENFPTPYELSQIGYTPGDISWPGKTGMIGSEWAGVKRL